MTTAFAAAPAPSRPAGALHHHWTRAEITVLFKLPLPELMVRAQEAHRLFFDPTEVQIADVVVDQDRRLPGGIAPAAPRARIMTPGLKPRS